MGKKTGCILSCILVIMLAFPVQAKAEEPLETEAKILNSASLSPQGTGIADLDALVASTVEQLTEDGMDTYEKVKACYDYLLENMSYASSMGYLNVAVGSTTCADLFYDYGEVNGFGAVALTSNRGLCNGYSAGFILMARYLGLDAQLVSGYTVNSGGGYEVHKWTEIEIEGTTYVFDPQLDQQVESWGLPAYSLFCKTYEQTGGRYSKS